MGHYVAGRSMYENCGPLVIVSERTLVTLESAAPVIRALLGSASRASSIAELGALLDKLPVGYTPEWQQIVEEDDQIADFDAPPPASLYERCVEAFFYCSGFEAYSPTLVLDTTACYRDMVDADPLVRAAVWPFIATALHDLDAGFDTLEDPLRALEGSGHTCCRDDERIAHVFGHLMTDAFLRADEIGPR